MCRRIVRRCGALGVVLPSRSPGPSGGSDVRRARLIEWASMARRTDSSSAASTAGDAGAAARRGGAPDEDRRLFLIDGPSVAYRAFFALSGSISTSHGLPTTATFGFASMLVKIVSGYGW